MEAVERWAKAHPEEAADATKPKQDEPRVKTIQDNLEGAIYRAIASHKTRIEKLEYDISVVRNNLAELHDKTYKEQQVEVKKEQSCGNNALEERVDHLKKCFDEMNERLTCFIHDTVDEVQSIKKHAEHQDEFMQTKCVHVDSEEVESMNEPKRTNKDVILATFPRMVMDGGVPVLCPRTMDRDINIQYCAGRSCYQCRREYWFSEVEE